MGHRRGDLPSFRKGPNESWGAGTSTYREGDPPSPFRRRVSWATVFTILVVWSGAVYAGYLAIDFALNWMASNGSAILQTGKNAGDTLGVGKEISSTIDRLKNAGFMEPAFAFLRKALAPIVFVIWALGAVCIMALPILLTKIRRSRFSE